MFTNHDIQYTKIVRQALFSLHRTSSQKATFQWIIAHLRQLKSTKKTEKGNRTISKFSNLIIILTNPYIDGSNNHLIKRTISHSLEEQNSNEIRRKSKEFAVKYLARFMNT